MATLYTHIDSNKRKTVLFITFFLVFIIGLGVFFSWYLDSYFILVFAVAYSVGMSFISYWWSDKITLAISRAKPLEKKDDPKLYNMVENLCITAGLPVPRIYTIEEPAMNAFTTGRDPEHAILVLTRGAVQFLEPNELQGVIAHELAHIGNRDILLSTIVVVLVGVVTLISDFFLRFMFFGRRGRGGGQGGIIMLVIGLALMILAPLAAALIQLAISRKREFLADASGALLTRYPEGLASALEKISKDQNPQLRGANHATEHLYIENPFKKKRGVMSKMFSTHPPVEERIRALRDMKT